MADATRLPSPMAAKHDDERFEWSQQASPRIVGFAPDAPLQNTAQDEMARMLLEQRRLRERQDELERALAASRQTGDGKQTEPKGDGPEEDHETADAKALDGARQPKPGLMDRLRRGAREHPYRAAGIAIGIVIALACGVLFYAHTLTYEDTDDAQIDGDISTVSPRINGTVTAVYVVDNQAVHTGDPIADLDSHDYDVALDQARAQLHEAEAQVKVERPNVPITTVTNRTTISTSAQDVATAEAELATAQRELAQAQAQVAQAAANAAYAQVDSARSAYLASVGAVAQSDTDQRTSAADATAAALAAAQQAALAAQKRIDEQRAKLSASQTRLEEARKNAPQQLEAREATIALREAAVTAARAELEQAELNKSYAHILAPVDGILGQKSVNVGDRVQPGQQLAGITQMAHLWVTANFRETQLRKMRPGQRVKVHVDALDLDFNGSVESMPGATGSRYSLLPPENATGNYVKVVQRLPVRIKLDDGQQGYDRLRPGMSVEPTVSLR